MSGAPPIPDAVWQAVGGLLPDGSRRMGRPRLDNRRVLSGILYVRLAEVGWNRLPKEFGFGAGNSCRRRYRAWTGDGTWEQVERRLTERLLDDGPGEGLAHALEEWRRELDGLREPIGLSSVACSLGRQAMPQVPDWVVERRARPEEARVLREAGVAMPRHRRPASPAKPGPPALPRAPAALAPDVSPVVREVLRRLRGEVTAEDRDT